MSKLAIDFEEVISVAMEGGGYQATTLWGEPVQGMTFTDAIKMMHERTLRIAEVLDTIVNVLPTVVDVPKGQRPGSDGFKP